MELLLPSTVGTQDLDASSALEQRLEHYSGISRLEILTEFLNLVPRFNEDIDELVHAVWSKICQEDLWALKFSSFGDFSDYVCYTQHIRPAIARHRKSEKTKLSACATICKNWKVPVTDVLPACQQPQKWSKHVLSLLASLSRLVSLDDARSLCVDSIQRRPARGRNSGGLIASDVARILKELNSERENRQNEALGQGSSQISQVHSPRRDCSSIEFGAVARDDDPPSELNAQSSSMDYQTYNGFDVGTTIPQLPMSTSLGTEPIPEFQTTPGSLECGCSAMCLPLSVLLSSQHCDLIDTEVHMQLVSWARNLSWDNLCSLHLSQLSQAGGSPSSSSAGSPEREEIITELEVAHIISEMPREAIDTIDVDLENAGFFWT